MVFASALPWQPGFALLCFASPSPSFIKCFKDFARTNTANYILFVARYIIIKLPNKQFEGVGLRRLGTQGTAESGRRITRKLESVHAFGVQHLFILQATPGCS